eukprot:768540-Hanusia_phi.AAC.3
MELIDSVRIFAHLDRSTRQSLADRLRVITFNDGATIVERGSFADSIFFIQKGHALLMETSGGGERIRRWCFCPGDWFGEIIFGIQNIRKWTVISAGNCTCTVLTFAEISECLGEQKMDESMKTGASLGLVQVKICLSYASFAAIPMLQPLLCPLPSSHAAPAGANSNKIMPQTGSGH